MELDDLKNTWDEASNQVSKTNSITPKMIDQMTQTKYKARLKKIAYPEFVGTIICFAGAGFILLNFGKLNSLFLQITGIMTMLLLTVLPVVSLLIIRQLNIIGNVNKPYAETLKIFARQKLLFFKFQKTSLLLCYILLVFIIILSPAFFGGKSVNDKRYFWMFAFAFGYLFLFFFSKWVLKHYGNTMRQAEELLQELEL